MNKDNIEETASFKEELRNGVAIFRLSGRLDAVTSTDIEKRVFDLIDGGKERVLLDLTHVTYLSSGGLRMMLSTTKRLRSHDRKLCLFGTTDKILDIFKMSGLDHILEIFQNEEEAFRHI